MDSEHRHELKTNELADGISKIPSIIKKNYMQIIGVGLIIAAILFSGPVKRHFENKKLARQAEASVAIRNLQISKGQAIQSQSESPLITSASELEIVAGEAKEADLAATAYIKRAEALRASLHYGAEDAEAEVVASRIADAQKAYEQAIAKAGDNVTLSAKAQYGLGLCAEELADYDGAKVIYKKIIDTGDYAATVFPTQAQVRLDNMEDNKAEFVFIDVPEPEPQPETPEPARAPEPVEITVEPEEEKAVEPVEIIVEPETKKPVETVVE
jgi:tetratricopeptide (TPR) repeat protein